MYFLFFVLGVMHLNKDLSPRDKWLVSPGALKECSYFSTGALQMLVKLQVERIYLSRISYLNLPSKHLTQSTSEKIKFPRELQIKQLSIELVAIRN